MYCWFSAVLTDEFQFWISIWTCKHVRGTIMKAVRSKYGEKVLKQRPWLVNDYGQFLLIKGVLPLGVWGGVDNIIIRKSDGKILDCFHTK